MTKKHVANELTDQIIKKVESLEKKLMARESLETLITHTIASVWNRPIDLRIPTPRHRRRTNLVEVAVANLSDTQIGKITDTYNSKIAELRILKFADKLIEQTELRRRGGVTIDELKLIFGGDMVEGEGIYEGQVFEIDSSVFEQSVKTGCTILVKFVLKLLKYFEKIKIIGVAGNHGRNGKRGVSSLDTNWDNVLYYAVRHVLLGNADFPRTETQGRIEFPSSDDWYQIEDVLGHKLLITHGDAVGSGGASPWQTIQSKVVKWADSLEEHFDHVWLGHFHTYSTLTSNRKLILINGSTESDSEYVQQQLGVTSIPCQRLSFYNREDGLVCDCQILLDERHSHVPNSEETEE